jgi:hypothetical protein
MKWLMAYVIQGRGTSLFKALFASGIADANITPESSSNDWSYSTDIA